MASISCPYLNQSINTWPLSPPVRTWTNQSIHGLYLLLPYLNQSINTWPLSHPVRTWTNQSMHGLYLLLSVPEPINQYMASISSCPYLNQSINT
jgi:hypothetical protein